MFLFVCTVTMTAPVLIITHNCNRPDLIPLQYASLQKHLYDEYEYLVYNDAKAASMRAQINETCAQLGISCIEIDQTIHQIMHTPRYHCAAATEPMNHISQRGTVIQHSLQHKGFEHNGIVALFDADLFLIKDFSITAYMQDIVLAGTLIEKDEIAYPWPGLIFINMPICPDKQDLLFTSGRANERPFDPGQMIHHFIESHPEISVDFFDKMYCPTADFKSFEKVFHTFLIEGKKYKFELLLNNTFLHYKGCTNWNYDSESFHEKKTAILKDFLEHNDRNESN